MDVILTHLSTPTAPPSVQNHLPKRGLPKIWEFVSFIPSINKTCSNRLGITSGQFPIQPFA